MEFKRLSMLHVSRRRLGRVRFDTHSLRETPAAGNRSHTPVARIVNGSLPIQRRRRLGLLLGRRRHPQGAQTPVARVVSVLRVVCHAAEG